MSKAKENVLKEAKLEEAVVAMIDNDKTKTPEEVRDELISRINDLIYSYNEASVSNNITEASIADASIKSLIRELDNACKIVTYSELSKAEIPMVAAARAFRYDSYKVNDLKDDLTGIITKELVETTPIIGVLEFDKFCGGHAGVNPDWKYKMERLHCAILIRRANTKNLSPEKIKALRDNYAMTAMAKKFNDYHDVEKVTEGADPASNTSLNKALQEIINDMIGKTDNHKMRKKDVMWMLDCYAKEGSGYNSQICSRKDYARILFKICAKVEREGIDADYEDVLSKADRKRR